MLKCRCCHTADSPYTLEPQRECSKVKLENEDGGRKICLGHGTILMVNTREGASQLLFDLRLFVRYRDYR